MFNTMHQPSLARSAAPRGPASSPAMGAALRAAGPLLCLLLLAGTAAAVPVPASRTVFPAAKLRELAPILRSSDMALLEADGRGMMRQITAISFAAAPAETVRQVIVHPERYNEFIRNMGTSTVKPAPGGTVDLTYEFDYRITTIGGTTRYVQPPPGPGGELSVDLYDPVPEGTRWHRFDLLPVPGGTVVVLSGYTDVHHSSEPVPSLISRVPTLEYGLALISQMTLILSMKQRAEQIAGPQPAAPAPAAAPGAYGFLVEKGTLALFRSRQGRLTEMTLVARSRAAPEALGRAVGQVADWSQYMPSITRSTSLPREGQGAVELEQSMPLLTFRTAFGVYQSAGTVDMLGMSGDLRGARLRWDVRPSGAGSQLVLRCSMAYDKASMIIRQLYKLEPLFEYGINLGLNLVLLDGALARAGGGAPALKPPANTLGK